MKEVYFAEFIEQNFTFSKVLILTHEYVNNLEKQSPVSLQVKKLFNEALQNIVLV
jgi:hypothetical protein